MTITPQAHLSSVTEAPAPTRSLAVRRERAWDADAIAQVHTDAFSGPDLDGAPPTEVALVEAIRSSNAYVPGLSLVAEVGEDIVGHVLCSRAVVGDRYPALALAPLAVRPDARGAGVGSALVHAALGAADALGHPMVAVLGSTDWYPRFGFRPSTEVGVEAPAPWWGEHFQVRLLTTAVPTMQGRFRHAPAFQDAVDLPRLRLLQAA